MTPETTTATGPTHTSGGDEANWMHPLIILVLLGVALLALAQLISFFTVVGDLPGEMVAPMIFGTFGSIAVGIGLALAGAWLRGLSAGVRAAMLIGGSYFATSGNLVGNFLGAFSSSPF